MDPMNRAIAAALADPMVPATVAAALQVLAEAVNKLDLGQRDLGWAQLGLEHRIREA